MSADTTRYCIVTSDPSALNAGMSPALTPLATSPGTGHTLASFDANSPPTLPIAGYLELTAEQAALYLADPLWSPAQ